MLSHGAATGHTYNVGGLDVVLDLGDLVLELLDTNLVVLNDQGDLQLADTVADGNELGGAPY